MYIIFESFVSGGNAAISLIFSEYMNRIFWHTTAQDVSPDDIPRWAIKATAIVAVAVITVICVVARKLGTRIAVVFTAVKVLAPFICEELDLHSNTDRFLPS